jgi:hypothetical protein
MSITGNFNQGRRRFLTSASMAAGAAMLPTLCRRSARHRQQRMAR